jgi:hypothetical protein
MLLAVALLCGAIVYAQESTPAPAKNPVVNSAESPTAPPVEAPVPTTLQLKGKLLERGTKRPLGGVNIFVLPHKLKSTTNDLGNFTIDQVPEGAFEWVINAPGYLRLNRRSNTQTDDAAVDKDGRVFYLEREAYGASLETTVTGQADRRDQAKKSLTQQQFLMMPGAQGDPVKAVQNLPGVARAGGFSSQVIIQGAAPQDTDYAIDTHNVPIIFHFGGLTSVVFPEATQQVDFFSGGYGAEYSRAIGGVINLQTKRPRTDRYSGLLFADTAKAGALVEGPIGEKGSLLLGARYSYIGAVLRRVLAENKQFNLTVAPEFADVVGLYDYKWRDDVTFKLTTVGSRDTLEFLFKEPFRENPALRGNFRNETSFWRVIPQVDWRRSSEERTSFSTAVGQDRISVDTGDNYFDLVSESMTVRGEHEIAMSSAWKTQIGVDNQYSNTRVRFRFPESTSAGGVGGPLSGGSVRELDVRAKYNLIGAYWRNELVPSEESRWTFLPSLRADYFAPTKELLPAPRLQIRYALDPSTILKYSSGLYFQPPQPQETVAGFGNPDLKSPRAWHFVAGVDQDFKQAEGFWRDWSIQSQLFYRLFENLVIQSERFVNRGAGLEPERYNNEGKGRSFGAEFLVKWDSKPWSTWVAYTISRSTRTLPGRGEFVFQFDQTHNINWILQREFARNWTVSSRLRYVTGNPYTPVTEGVFDANNDAYTPIRGGFFSERLQDFVQLDLRVDKKWISDEMILWVYLDIQNATNAQNPEAIRYSYDFSQKKTITGLPLFPLLGVRGEF